MALEILSQEPRSREHATPLLFVHGAWHGAWCWQEHFLPYFADQGYMVYAVSLRGHGNSPGRENLRWHRVDQYVADVAGVAADLPTPPVVIGHSMGGLVVQKYLEKHKAPAAVLMASVPPHGAYQAALRFTARVPLQMAKVNLTMSLYPLIETLELAHRAVFSPEMPDDRVRQYFAKMQDESYFGFLDMMLFRHDARSGMARSCGPHYLVVENTKHLEANHGTRQAHN